MGKDFTEGGIVQHLSKLRAKMVENNMHVPPPLKRGMVTKEPSKIYATPKKTQVKKIEANTPTPSKPKSRKKGKRDASDDEEDNMVMSDLYDDSDDEYGSVKKRVKRGEKQLEDSGNISGGFNEQVIPPTTPSKESEEDSDIAVPAGPASRTRGYRRDYSKIDEPATEDEMDDTKVIVKEENIEGKFATSPKSIQSKSQNIKNTLDGDDGAKFDSDQTQSPTQRKFSTAQGDNKSEIRYVVSIVHRNTNLSNKLQDQLSHFPGSVSMPQTWNPVFHGMNLQANFGHDHFQLPPFSTGNHFVQYQHIPEFSGQVSAGAYGTSFGHGSFCSTRTGSPSSATTMIVPYSANTNGLSLEQSFESLHSPAVQLGRENTRSDRSDSNNLDANELDSFVEDDYQIFEDTLHFDNI